MADASVCQGERYRSWGVTGADGGGSRGGRALPSGDGHQLQPGTRREARRGGAASCRAADVPGTGRPRLRDGARPTAQDVWAEAVPQLRGSWEMLKEKYGYEERPEPAPQADGGSWRGKGGRTLDAASNAEIDLGYARIREVGQNVIGPAILRVAAEDPTRTLAGFDRRIKGEDRLKEKVAD